MTDIRDEISIVICAYTTKRWAQLKLAVESALRQHAHEVLLVIDHNSELFDLAVQEWGDRVHVLANEQAQGLSGARNTALDWAEGARIAFLDDDATAADDWLAQLAAPFATDSNIVAVGGAANPVWINGKAPSFMPRDLYWVIGCSFDGQATELEDVRNIMGCSMLFDTATLRRLGGFNTATGRVGTLPLGAEETEACIKIKQQNPAARILFQPASVVNHHVSEDRMHVKYMLRRGYYEGISKAYITRNLNNTGALGTEKSYAIKLIGKAARYAMLGRMNYALSLISTLSATVAGYLVGRVLITTKYRKVVAAAPSPLEAM